MTDISKVTELYRKKFIPPYAEAVALSVFIPEQVLVENTNVLAHICQADNPDLAPEKQAENLLKAESHLIRATLDVHKFIWAELRELLDPLVEDAKSRICFNLSVVEVRTRHKQFIEAGKLARKYEMEHVGNDPLESVKQYIIACDIGRVLYAELDTDKVKKMARWRKIYWVKDNLVGLVTGFVAGFLANYVYGKFS